MKASSPVVTSTLYLPVHTHIVNLLKHVAMGKECQHFLLSLALTRPSLMNNNY